MVKRAVWLSVTPESERELPRAVATLRAGASPPAAAVAAEAARVERLILHGSQRRWLAYLHEVVGLVEGADLPGEHAEVAAARARALAVVANHHNLLLALPGPGARLTADDRTRLSTLTRGAA